MTTATLTNGFTYGEFAVTDITPDNGLASGGEPVTISGTTFNENCVIYIGDYPLVNQTYVSDTEITGETPEMVAGTYAVKGYEDGQLSTLPSAFRAYNALSLTNVSPASGTEDGGTPVNIYGNGFNALTVVTIGGSVLTDPTVVNDGLISGITPAGTLGAADVIASNETGPVTLTDGYTYTKQLDIYSVSPGIGYVSGGQAITINGTGFVSWESGDTLSIGGVECTDVVRVSDASLTAVTPTGAIGATDVVLDASYGTVTLTNGFTYIADVSASTVAPTSGYVSGGTAITITGTSFDSTALITIDGNPVTELVVVSSTSITANTPPGTIGAKDVVVTINGEVVTLVGAYTYLINPDDPIGPKQINDSFQDLLRVPGGLTDSVQTVLDAQGRSSAMQASVNEVKITKLIIGE